MSAPFEPHKAGAVLGAAQDGARVLDGSSPDCLTCAPSDDGGPLWYARALLADATVTPDDLLILACETVEAQSPDAKECDKARAYRALLERRA